MNREQIYAKMKDVFIDVFDDENITLSDSVTAKDVEGWDSLTHIALLAAIEDEFGITFDMKAVQGLKNVGDMADLIMELLK